MVLASECYFLANKPPLISIQLEQPFVLSPIENHILRFYRLAKLSGDFRAPAQGDSKFGVLEEFLARAPENFPLGTGLLGR